MWRQRITKFHWILLVSTALAVAVWVTTSGALRWILLSALCSASGLWIGLGVSFPRLQMFGRSLCVFSTSRNDVAVTFDDGPDPKTTPALLEILAQRNVPATFFCVGQRAQQHPELVRRLTTERHQVENHSYAHSHWTNFYSMNRLRTDLEQAQSAIESLTGKRPTLFRPPIGLTNLRVFKVAESLRLQVTGYAARALDHRSDSPEEIGRRLLSKLKPGAILLLHDGGVPVERATAVLKYVLDELDRRGFHCVTLTTPACGKETYGGKPSIATSSNPH